MGFVNQYSNQHFVSGVFESNEPIFNPFYLKYPLNAITSILYWLPLIYIHGIVE